MLRLSLTLGAEPLGKCSPGHSDNGANSQVRVILTPTGKWLGGRRGEGWDGRKTEWGGRLQGIGAGIPRAETPLSFGFGFGSGDCGWCRGKGSGAWDLRSDPEGETGRVMTYGKKLGRYLRTKGKTESGGRAESPKPAPALHLVASVGTVCHPFKKGAFSSSRFRDREYGATGCVCVGGVPKLTPAPSHVFPPHALT